VRGVSPFPAAGEGILSYSSAKGSRVVRSVRCETADALLEIDREWWERGERGECLLGVWGKE
jgi:hypothetical protein